MRAKFPEEEAGMLQLPINDDNHIRIYLVASSDSIFKNSYKKDGTVYAIKNLHYVPPVLIRI